METKEKSFCLSLHKLCKQQINALIWISVTWGKMVVSCTIIIGRKGVMDHGLNESDSGVEYSVVYTDIKAWSC